MSRKLPDLIFGAKGAERRINATVGAILVLLVLVAGTAVFFVLTRQLQVQIENGLVGTLADKTSFFHSTMDASAEKVEDIVARHPRLRELLLAVDAGTAGPAELREIGAILGNTLLHRNVSAIELSDVHARVVDTRGEFLRDPIATTALRDPQHTTLLWKGQYHLQIAAPIEENGKIIGTLKMEIPLPDITRVLQDYRELGESGEILICAPLRQQRMRCFPSRHQQAGFESSRHIDGVPLPMSDALDGKSGMVTMRDYRRHNVFDAYQPIGDSGLGMVVKIDSDELEQPIRRHLLWIVPLLAALVALGSVLVRWQVGPLVRRVVSSSNALRQAHDELVASFASLQATQSRLVQAELDKDRQMNALAEANVRMVLFHTSMERLRDTETSFSGSGDAVPFYRDILSDAVVLTGAKYGAVGLFDEDGKLRQFLTEGISEAARQKIGVYPTGKGLLHAFYQERKIARVGRIAADPRCCGFPPGHPPMTSLLGVPLVVGGATKGVIYLTDKNGGETFTEQDEMLMEMLAQGITQVMERNELLASLRQGNQVLVEEREKQQQLITRLEEAQTQLLQSEKMASIGQLAAGVAHEINNPIGYVHSNLGSLETYVTDLFRMLDAYANAEPAQAGNSRDQSELARLKNELDLDFLREDILVLVGESKEGLERVRKIVQDLKDFSRVDSSQEWQRADLHCGLDSTLNVINNEIKYKADVIREYGELPEVECLPSQLNQVFMNLLVNAAHAIGADQRGTITLRSGCAGKQVWVEVTDSGSGIAPEHLKQIFDPFFTTKPVGKGTGLGLSVSYGIVKKHGGSIDVNSKIGIGTTFKVWLPVSQAHREVAP